MSPSLAFTTQSETLESLSKNQTKTKNNTPKTGESLSLSKQVQRHILLGIAKYLPSAAQTLAWHHFTRPRKTRAYSLKDLPNQATPLQLKYRNAPLKGYSWGESDKRIYLVHGWESNVSKLKHFVLPLVKLGFQVIAFDLPAHGQSKHKTTNFKDCVDALESIIQTYGKPHGIIAHSGGATMTVNMLAKNPNLTPEKLSLISPMLSAQTHIDVFSRVAGLPSYLKNSLTNKLEQTTQLTLENTSITKLIKNISSDGIVCHDHNDSYIPYAYGKAIANAWQAKLHSSHKLGHRRILRNSVVIDKIVEHTKY